MTFNMKKPSIMAGTRAHKEALKLNRSMDNSSLEDGKAKSSAFQKKTDPTKKDTRTPSEKHDKPAYRELKGGETWRKSSTGEKDRAKKYEVLQDDGTYKAVTNPSGSGNKTRKDLRDTEKNYVTKEMDAASKKQQVDDMLDKVNKKSAKKQKRKETVKKVKTSVSNFFTGKGPGGRNERKRKKDYDKQVAKDKKPIKTEPHPEYVAYQKTLKNKNK